MTRPVPAYDWIGHHADIAPDRAAALAETPPIFEALFVCVADPNDNDSPWTTSGQLSHL